MQAMRFKLRPVVLVAVSIAFGVTACGETRPDVASDGTDHQTGSVRSAESQGARPDPAAFVETVSGLPYWQSMRLGIPRTPDALAAESQGFVVGTIEDIVLGEKVEVPIADLVNPAGGASLPTQVRPMVLLSAEVIVRVDEAVGNPNAKSGRAALSIPMALRPADMGGPTAEEMLAALEEVAPIGGRLAVFVSAPSGGSALQAVPPDGLARLAPPGLDGVLFEDARGGVTSLHPGLSGADAAAHYGMARFAAAAGEADALLPG